MLMNRVDRGAKKIAEHFDALVLDQVADIDRIYSWGLLNPGYRQSSRGERPGRGTDCPRGFACECTEVLDCRIFASPNWVASSAFHVDPQ